MSRAKYAKNNKLTAAEGDEMCRMVRDLLRMIRDEVDGATTRKRPIPKCPAQREIEMLLGDGTARSGR